MAQVSIDKIALVGNITHAETFRSFIEQPNNLYINRIGRARVPYETMVNMVDGSCLQLARPHSNVPQVRFEFNPNKARLDEVAALLTFFKHLRPTRIDTAIDIHGMDFSKWLVVDTASRGEITYQGRSKELETKYLGGARCSRKVRIYNKALEQKDESGKHWWRFETEQHFTPQDTNYFPDDLFTDFYLVQVDTIQKFPTLCMATALRDHPELMGRADKRMKSKMRQTLLEEPETIMELWKPYKESKTRLEWELSRYIGHSCTSHGRGHNTHTGQHEAIPF